MESGKYVNSNTTLTSHGVSQAQGITDSTLALHVNHASLLILCGAKVYRGFPPEWSDDVDSDTWLLLSPDIPP